MSVKRELTVFRELLNTESIIYAKYPVETMLICIYNEAKKSFFGNTWWERVESFSFICSLPLESLPSLLFLCFYFQHLLWVLEFLLPPFLGIFLSYLVWKSKHHRNSCHGNNIRSCRYFKLDWNTTLFNESLLESNVCMNALRIKNTSALLWPRWSLWSS